MLCPAQSVTSFEPRKSDNVHKHRKESSFRRQLSLVDLSNGKEIACVRFYGNGERAYCCAWFHEAGQYARGSGWAGGYGYHKDSAAMQSALNAAGWRFSKPFSGVGETGEQGALEAIARWLDIPAFVIVMAHP
jgi:hypothetical protein